MKVNNDFSPEERKDFILHGPYPIKEIWGFAVTNAKDEIVASTGAIEINNEEDENKKNEMFKNFILAIGDSKENKQ